MHKPLLAVCLAALCAVPLGCAPKGSLQTCTTSADCPSPQSCVSGACVNSACGVGAPTCTSDSQCSAHQHCAQNCCAAGDPGTCTTSADCSSETGTTVCNPLSGQCVACVANRDCGTGHTCSNNVCVGTGGCFANSDCKTTAAPVCDVNTRSCVQCMASTDCTNAADPVCNANHICVTSSGCSSDASCSSPTPRCAPGGACVQCLATSDCAQGLSCSASHTCVQPSATTCNPGNDAGVDTDCASSPSTPHCAPSAPGSSSGSCVECVTTDQCPPADLCTASNACQPLRCATNGDCQNPVAPVCNTGANPPGCVACLQNSDCANGGTCRSDHTCQAPVSVCSDDSGCASNTADPHCAIISGGQNKCVACRLAGQCGNGVTCPNDCGEGQSCGTGNVCQNISCTIDSQCTDPRRPHCDPGANGQPGVCVACVSAAQCPVGDRCDSSNSCVPICTAATQAQDCPVGSPLCKVSPAGNSCVQCLSDTDCSGATPTCSSSNVCIATPPTGCQTNSDCPAGQHVCDTSQNPHACVQCLANVDCTNGDICVSATDTCQPPPEGGEGEACLTDGSCNTGLLCVDEGGASPVCRAQCDPTNDTVCANISASDVCEWLNFDDSGVLIGICEPGNGHGQSGAACDPSQIDSCEWNLLCAATSSSGGVCAPLCTPGSSCASGGCNAIVGALGSSGQALKMGYCSSATSAWGTACVTDTSASGPNCGDALDGAGSGSALFCIPSTLPAEFPAVNLLATCQYGPAASTAIGGTDTDCSALSGSACRTGLCLSDGSQTCFAGCQYNADCTRDCTAEGGCATTSDCFSVNFSEGNASGAIGTCEPICRDDLDCPSGSCQPAPVMSGTSWQAICGPVAGAGKAGSPCAGGATCESGVCLTASTLEAIELGVTATGTTATDGFCLGACLPSANDCATGSSCSTTAALPLTPTSTGDLGVVGKVNPGICFPITCASDAACTGLSADENTPRVCSPYKTATLASVDTAKKCTSDSNCTGSSNWVATCNSSANNPNPGSAFGTNAGIFGPNGACRAVSWSLGCLPSQGAGKGGGGATCSAASDCQTGHCVNNGTVSYCFGGCTSDGDCTGGTSCQTGSYLGLSGKHCMP